MRAHRNPTPSPMRGLAAQAGLAIALGFALPHSARADASLLVGTAASTIGTQAAANLVSTPYAGLGVFA